MSSRSPISVLLVDDDADTRNIFRVVMAHHNLDLTVAEDAETALEYLQTHSPDIIVLDIFMPGTDGPQALAQIRRLGLAPKSVIVATTAFHTQQTPRDVEEWGFNGYLPKPLNSSNLVPSLERIFQGSAS